MRGGSGGQMISIYPEELSFEVELEKPSSCNIKVVNNTEHHVAFKVKTTSPKKYFVRPNASVVQPWDSCTVTVTLQAQKELPPDMQCKDKFLIQSAKVPPTSHIDEIPKDTFNKEVERVIEDLKLRVVYIPRSENGHANPEEESGRTSDVKLPNSYLLFQIFSCTFFDCFYYMICFLVPQMLKNEVSNIC
ncbi:hypothetical protein ZIOFF_032624 [Zingiber officinale]|uniref:MSP domain-containing protein n=1 Tax=Zingiber officinale TaxID=94328 RepID=A0A8J5GIN2_ZINOF|nr:hypothetical protein ZIOFF_032624 [Zingiber officinale]